VSEQLTYANVKSLPVLNAVVWETLRMYPAIPSSLARRVPCGGAPVTGVPGGAWLPPDTVVSASTVTLQRNADVFPDPDAWRPERWLAGRAIPTEPLFPSPSSAAASSPHVDAGDGKAGRAETNMKAGEVVGDEALTIYDVDDEMSAHMQVFSRGIRSCLGKPIAHMGMKLAAAALAQRYPSVSLADALATVDDMRMMDVFVLVPKGKRCMLIFK
jgi:cytochrome P450